MAEDPKRHSADDLTEAAVRTEAQRLLSSFARGRTVSDEAAVEALWPLIRWYGDERAKRALQDAATNMRVGVARSAVITERAECHKKQCACGHPSEDRLVDLIADRFRDALSVRADEIGKAP